MIRYLDLTSDTICAPITGASRAAVATVRVSGDQASRLVSKCLDRPVVWRSHRSSLRHFLSQGVRIDQVLVTYFAKQKSFTGDEVVEISCHGSPLITQKIVGALIESGCRFAEPGEFSFRAFYNGKIDLAQAESINQLVASTNARATSEHAQALSGQLSTTLLDLEGQLLDMLAELEASIDFSEEDIETTPLQNLQPTGRRVLKRIEDLLETYAYGRSLDRGAKVLLLGATNVGKSSLFNRFCGEDRAIVTNTPGTTRDVLRAQVFMGQTPIELMDTAGLRESFDEIEKLGMARGLQELDLADRILFVLDGQNPNLESLQVPSYERVFLVINKIDSLPGEQSLQLRQEVQSYCRAKGIEDQQVFWVSAQSGEGLAALQKGIEVSLSGGDLPAGQTLITQARHYNHLNTAKDHLLETLNLMESGASPDLLSQELQMALLEIHGILGKTYDDEILDRIFSQFCIGK